MSLQKAFGSVETSISVLLVIPTRPNHIFSNRYAPSSPPTLSTLLARHRQQGALPPLLCVIRTRANTASKPTHPCNNFLAHPIRAPDAFVKQTCWFDYQPEICKDYKQTGLCGFGDTYIYLHNRGDTLSGWYLEREWEERQNRDQDAKEREVDLFI